MSYPFFTVHIPTYNQAKFIKECVQSVANQSFKDIEIIISDDCSKDETRQIVESLAAADYRITYFHNGQNLGRVANYRKGLMERARGQFFINLDGDDFFTDPDFLKKAHDQIVGLTEKGHAVLAFSAKCEKYFDAEKAFKKRGNGNHWNGPVTAAEYFRGFRSFGFAHASTVFNRKKTISSGFYERNLLSADIFSLLSLCIEKPESLIILHDQPTSAWRMHGDNASGSPSWKQLWPSLAIYFELNEKAKKAGIRMPAFWPLRQIAKPIARFVFVNVLSVFKSLFKK